MERLVLDTSAYSHFRSGNAAVIEHIAMASTIVLPSVVLGELHAAFALGRRQAENSRVLTEFLEEPFVNVHNVTAATARHYGHIFPALRRAGTPIPLNDVWIAAATFDCGGHLLTFDQDFQQVDGLQYTLLTASQ